MSKTVRCPHVLFDQLGMPVCTKNLDAPGDCTPSACPYVIVKEEEG